LIVDDEPDVILTLKTVLEVNGFKVDAFNDPILALSNFKTGSYTLVLTDIKIPKMNGFKLYQEIKKIDDKVKVCFMTAYDMYYEEFRRVLPELNERCFANKPITIDDLARRIKNNCRRKKIQLNSAFVSYASLHKESNLHLSKGKFNSLSYHQILEQRYLYINYTEKNISEIWA
jgi:DNA-binding response OmpR family regulator